ncbi:dead end protein 1 [Aplochiton taeniatus]
MDADMSLVLNPERLKSLETWLKETNIRLTQVNGQRKYGGPPDDWSGPAPGPGCEVFISQIPRDAYEDRLIPLFREVGNLWEFRLMMNFSGQNRGFAYAKYGSPVLAAAAVRLLHGHQLEQGVRLSVRHSTEKRWLCLGGLPPNTGREQLLQALGAVCEGVEGVFLKAGSGDERVSAVVVYFSHHAASMAKKILVEAFKKRFTLSITVSWQQPIKTKSENVNPPRPAKNASPHKPPRRILESPRPPRLARPPPSAVARATGRPAASVPSLPASASSSSCGASLADDAVALLRSLCETHGGGPPLYHLQFHHAGPDGFLYFSYRVRVPGLAVPFSGLVAALPGASLSGTREEAHHAAAEQVLQALFHS